jgi:hypothetical protein
MISGEVLGHQADNLLAPFVGARLVLLSRGQCGSHMDNWITNLADLPLGGFGGFWTFSCVKHEIGKHGANGQVCYSSIEI